MKPHLKGLLSTALIAALLFACDNAPTAQSQPKSERERSAMLQTPKSISLEHRELHEVLARAAAEGGEIGPAAGELERALALHFKREEEIATPPLGLLPALAHGEATAEMRSVLPMTDALERELPQMLQEHEAIRTAVAQFRATAERKDQQDYVRFADNLAAHALQEEELLYPAAILVGRYVARTAPQR
jgi:hypothetical protein